MNFELRDVKDWTKGTSCTPTALAAVTGKSINEICAVLKNAAACHGREISDELRDDYNINDWLKAINLLGGNWAEADNFEETEFSERPTIKEWMCNRCGPDLELVFCDNGNSVGHVFATIEQDVVDTYTCGQRIKFSDVPKDFEVLRVKRSFLIWKS